MGAPGEQLTAWPPHLSSPPHAMVPGQQREKLRPEPGWALCLDISTTLGFRALLRSPPSPGTQRETPALGFRGEQSSAVPSRQSGSAVGPQARSPLQVS